MTNHRCPCKPRNALALKNYWFQLNWNLKTFHLWNTCGCGLMSSSDLWVFRWNCFQMKWPTRFELLLNYCRSAVHMTPDLSTVWSSANSQSQPALLNTSNLSRSSFKDPCETRIYKKIIHSRSEGTLQWNLPDSSILSSRRHWHEMNRPFFS